MAEDASAGPVDAPHDQISDIAPISIGNQLLVIRNAIHKS